METAFAAAFLITLRIVFMSSCVTFMELMVIDLGTFIQSMYCNRTHASLHYSFFSSWRWFVV